MSAINSQIGVKVESTYGTPVTVDRFFQFTKASLTVHNLRYDGEGIRSSGAGLRSDQVRVYPQGAELELEMELMTKGMGWWLKPMLGSNATTGPTDSAYTHTDTIATTYGYFFTLQGNFPLHPAGTSQPCTLSGCKVTTWELSCAKGGKLMLKMHIDARSLDTSTGLATASYAAAAVPYAWPDISLTLGGSALPTIGWTYKHDNNLNVDRFFQNGTALKSEPTRLGHPKGSFEFEKDFEALATVWNRVRATVASSAMAALVITATDADTGQTIGVGTQPSVTVTCPMLRLDDIGPLEINGPDFAGLTPKAMGETRFDGTNSMTTIAYVSADSTA